MKFLKITTLIFLLITISCKKDGNSVVQKKCSEEVVLLDDAFLEEESIQYMPYDTVTTIYFKNKNGEELYFNSFNTPNVRNNYNTVNINTFCGEDEIETYRFNRQDMRCSYNASELSLSINMRILPVFDSDLLFYDILRLAISNAFSNDPFSSNNLNIVTSYKGNYLDVPTDYVFLEELTLNHKLFKNVYISIKKNNEPPTDLYFNKEFGVIGFTDMENKLWVLDRFE